MIGDRDRDDTARLHDTLRAGRPCERSRCKRRVLPYGVGRSPSPYCVPMLCQSSRTVGSSTRSWLTSNAGPPHRARPASPPAAALPRATRHDRPLTDRLPPPRPLRRSAIRTAPAGAEPAASGVLVPVAPPRSLGSPCPRSTPHESLRHRHVDRAATVNRLTLRPVPGSLVTPAPPSRRAPPRRSDRPSCHTPGGYPSCTHRWAVCDAGRDGGVRPLVVASSMIRTGTDDSAP